VSDPTPEQQRLAEALLAMEARLHAVLSSLPIIVFALDADGVVTFAEGRGLSRLATEPGSIVGRNIDEVATADTAGLLHHLRRAQAGAEVSFLWERSGYVWDMRCSPILAKAVDGVQAVPRTVIGVTGIATDVTDRHAAERDVRWRSREIAALNAIMVDVSSVLAVEDVLDTLQRQLAQQLMIPGGVLHLIDFSRFTLEMHSSWGVPEVLAKRVGDPVSVLVSNSSESLACREAPGLYPEGEQEGLWQSGMCVPLLANDQMLGVLSLFGHDPMAMRKHRPTFYDTLGRQVGAAMQNARLFVELRTSREQMQALMRRLVEVQEQERYRLARELHDEIGQIVTGLKFTLDMAARELETTGSEKAVRHQDEAKGLVRELMGRVRQLSLDLRPTMLDDLGLLPALLWHLQRYHTQTGIRVTFQHGGLDRQRFPPLIETTAYRIVQEALTNIARHAGVSEAEVSVRADDASAVLTVSITDRGAGFDAHAASAAYNSSGLSGMRERAMAAGGTFRLSSDAARGTQVTAQLPLTTKAHAPVDPAEEAGG
jgi:signal transduction histidine kinase